MVRLKKGISSRCWENLVSMHSNFVVIAVFWQYHNCTPQFSYTIDMLYNQRSYWLLHTYIILSATLI